MVTTSTNELHIAALQFACNFGVGIAIALISCYTPRQLVEQISSTGKRSLGRFLWLLVSGVGYGSLIWLMQLSATPGNIFALTGLVTTVMMLLLAAVVVKKKETTNTSKPGEGSQREYTRSKACYRLIPQNSTDLISRYTPEGIYLYTSPACRTLLGYEPDELVGHCAYEFIHPQDVAAIGQFHSNKLNRLKSDTISYRIRREDGDYIWFESSMTPICHPNTGIVEEIFTVSRDITDRKQALEALENSERHFQKLTANMPGMIYQYLLRTDGSVSFPFVSCSARDIYELDPVAIQQNAAIVIDLIHPDDRKSFEDSVSVSAKTLQPWKWEGRIIMASGKLKWLQAASRPELQANGDILWDGMLMDITERKQAEEALYESEERFRVIFEQAGVAIAQVGLNGQFLRVNQKLCDIIGYKRRELLTKTVADITCPEDQAAAWMYLREFSSGQRQTINIEKRYIHKNGNPLWANVTVSLVRDATNAPKYCISVIEDITQRKQAEEAVQQANRERINIFESITEAFFAVDPEWRFTYINSKAEQYLLRKAKELLGRCIWDEFPEVVGTLSEVQYRRAVAEQVSVKFEEFYQPLNVWFVVRAFPYEGGLSVYFSDITDRKQAEAALLERSRLSTLAAKVGVALAERGALPAVLQRCTSSIVQQLDATSAAIWTINPASQQLEEQATAGQLTPLNPELLALVAQTRQPYSTSEETGGFQSRGRGVVGDAGGDVFTNIVGRCPPTSLTEENSPGASPASPAPLLSLHLTPDSPLPTHFFAYPLVVEDRAVGVLSVLGNQRLTEEADRTLNWVANAIAVAIDRYWARAELLSRRESLLFELANQIRNSLELDTILETAVQSIRSLFKIDRCHFLWYKKHESEPYWEVVNEARNPNLPSHIGKYKTSQVKLFAERLLRQQIIQVDEVETFSNPGLRQFLLDMGYTSLLSIPIKTQAAEIGVISCGHCTGARPWDESEVELLQAVVAQLAIALDQAELYAQARQAARVAEAQAKQLEHTLAQLQATQAKLVQSEKMSSLGQLVAGVAHEINNPISFIHGNIAYASAYIYDLLNLLHLYQEQYPNPTPPIAEQCELIDIDFIAKDLPKLLSSMQRGSDRIRSIVHSLRNFSRADEAHMKKVDVHEGIDSTLMLLQHRLKLQGSNSEIKVFKKYGNVPVVECYPRELNQVFLNILSNAIDAFEQSGSRTQENPSLVVSHPSPTITIRTSVLNSSNSTENSVPLLAGHHNDTGADTEAAPRQNPQSVVIQIADNGPGITESVRKRLFDPFFTTKPVGQGTGLGLSISYQIIVEHHNGVLTCTSTPGQGTEFWIEIPIQQMN